MPVLSDRYELGRPLGRGGMGEVYEAYDQKLSRRVAIKRVRSELADEHAQERFVREVRHTAAFAHPNVVTVFDVGDESDHPYFVMELVDGRTLAAALAAEGPLPVDEVTRIADAVLAGLAAAHARGLVHRDVKPSNVLLGADGSVKLSDFGIAKAVHDAAAPLTAAGEVLGTPTYLAPEQTRGEPAGPPADIYAVGVLLYEMLAGAPPFQGDTPLATALAHCDAPVPPLGDRREGLPPQLVGVVERALEKHPEQRFSDADAMRAALAGAATPAAEVESTVPGVVSTTRALPTVPPRPPARRSAPVRRPDRPRRRVAPVLVALGLLGALTVAAAFALRGGGSPDSSGAADQAQVVATDPTVATTTTVPTPTSPGELLAVLANNPLVYGPRGPELAERFAEVVSGDDERGRDALELTTDIPGWVSTGELDREIGALAQQMLGPYTLADQSGGDEGGNGKGKGNGRGSGGDEDSGD